jgi:hypothetical protein
MNERSENSIGARSSSTSGCSGADARQPDAVAGRSGDGLIGLLRLVRKRALQRRDDLVSEQRYEEAMIMRQAADACWKAIAVEADGPSDNST